MRQLQRLPARMSDRCRHGEGEDRVPGTLQGATWTHAERSPDRSPAGLYMDREPVFMAPEPARHGSRCRLAQRKTAWPVGEAPAAEMAARHILGIGRPL